MDRRLAFLFVSTLILVTYSRLALATSTCPKNYFLNSDGSCRGCNSCLPGVKIVKRCTNTSDTKCHSENKCDNPHYVYDARYDYHCRAVKAADCRDARLVSDTRTDCRTQGSNCRCRVRPDDHKKVECHCDPTSRPSPSRTSRAPRTSPLTSFSGSTRKSTVGPVTPSFRATPTTATEKAKPDTDTVATTDEETVGGDNNNDSLVILVIVICLLCVFLSVGLLFILRHRCNFISSGDKQRDSPSLCECETRNCILKQKSTIPKFVSYDYRREQLKHNKSHSNQVRSPGSPTGIPLDSEGRPLASAIDREILCGTSDNSGPVMAREVFNRHGDRKGVIDRLDQLHCNKPSWKEIADKLGYTHDEIKTMEGQCVNKAHTAGELLYDKWESRRDATINSLISAAKSAGRDDIVCYIINTCRSQDYEILMPEKDTNGVSEQQHDMGQQHNSMGSDHVESVV